MDIQERRRSYAEFQGYAEAARKKKSRRKLEATAACGHLNLAAAAARTRPEATDFRLNADRSVTGRFAVDVSGGTLVLVSAFQRGTVVSRSLDAQRLATCRNCLVLATTSKAKRFTSYLAVAGTVTHSSITGTGHRGTMEISFEGVVLVEWDIAADAPVSGGECLQADLLKLSSSWDR